MKKRRWTKHPPGKLLTKTIELLAASDKTGLEIYDGTGVSPDWQHKLVKGQITDPGVNRVEALYTFLSGRQLEV